MFCFCYHGVLLKNRKTFSTIQTRFVMTPDEIYHTYVDFNEDLELDINTYNIKAGC